jgi:transposase InsO family protein
VTYALIAECQGQWPVAWLCDALDVSPAGYYAWRDRPISSAERRRRNLLGAMTDIHAEVRQCYGSPRLAVELNNRGFPCSENFAADLMKTWGMQAKTPKRFVRTTDSRHDLPVAENVLDRDFSPSGPNHAWGADITYLPTSEGWLYLAVVEDLFSRRIVGWSMDATMTRRLVVDALHLALARRPETGLVAHSDRGSQYASQHNQGLLRTHGIGCSRSGVAQCWDNAPVESFFASLKRERDFPASCSRDDAKAIVFEYVELFYNPVPLHSSLGYLSPTEYERRHNPTLR